MSSEGCLLFLPCLVRVTVDDSGVCSCVLGCTCGVSRALAYLFGCFFSLMSQSADTTGLSRVTEDCGRQTEMEEAGCEIIGDAPYDLSGEGTDRRTGL